jgi:RsiW-degrading membrane proteinase PrsW (M82 family)
MREETRPSFWRSGLLSLAGLVLFVVLVALIPWPPLEGVQLLAVGVILALVPAMIWLVFFYQQDRKEPEPKRVVLRVFLFGALMAGGAGQRIIDLFRVEEWSYGSAWLQLGALILIVGFTEEFFKYAAVRYTVFPTDDFSGRVDGIIYGVTAGLGYATALNLTYVISNQGVVPFVGSLRMIDTALVQAGLVAITGYFLAGARSGDRPVWWVPAGLTIAAVLNGLVAFLREEVTAQGLTARPLNALFLSFALLTVALGVLFFMLRRAEWRARGQDLQEKAHGQAS